MAKGKAKAKAAEVENESALKHLFGPELLKRIGQALAVVHPSFDSKKLLNLMRELEPLEMKPRVQLIRDHLRAQLPADYRQAIKILLKSTRGGKLQGFDLWPYTEFVQTYGLEDLEISLDALKELTKLFTAEWGVRPFIKKDPACTM